MADPLISVIIASVNGLPSIDECLTALHRQKGNIKSEIIVVDCCRDGTADHIREKFPEVQLIHLPERLGIPELRAMGMSRAKGEYIAVTEDHCMAPENWYEEIQKAHASGYAAVGGTVVNGSVNRIVDWAVYLCEYSHVMPPIPSGEVDGIAGNNASYRREVLEKVDDSIKKNYWEFFLHEELRKNGVRFLSVPTLRINHKKEFGILYFLKQRYNYSRSFAGMRRKRESIAGRIKYLLASPILPILLLWRIARQVFQKGRHQREFFLSLPLLALFMVSYAAGEFIGYLLGPGASLAKVE